MSPQTRWTIIIVALLGSSLLVHGIMLVVALSDSSFAVEENYEQKAADWDERMRQRQFNRALDWSVDIDTAVAGPRGEVEVSVTLLDAQNAPIDDASLTLETFHNARATRKLRESLPARGDGLYQAVLPMGQSGVWEFRLTATRGDDTFTFTKKQLVAVR
jgi:nitrogen fixation protein FixH